MLHKVQRQNTNKHASVPPPPKKKNKIESRFLFCTEILPGPNSFAILQDQHFLHAEALDAGQEDLNTDQTPACQQAAIYFKWNTKENKTNPKHTCIHQNLCLIIILCHLPPLILSPPPPKKKKQPSSDSIRDAEPAKTVDRGNDKTKTGHPSQLHYQH